MIPSSILRKKSTSSQKLNNTIPPNMGRTRFNDEYFTDDALNQEQPNPIVVASNLTNISENINSSDLLQNTNTKISKKGKDKKSMTIIKHFINSFKH